MDNFENPRSSDVSYDDHFRFTEISDYSDRVSFGQAGFRIAGNRKLRDSSSMSSAPTVGASLDCA